jgi:microcystin-dependent protein
MANLQDLTNRSEVGAIKPWGKSTAPAGYVLCDGTAISRTDYADLFAVIGTTYGVGNGSSTFNVPDLQGKMPQGYDGGSSYDMAGTGGANTVTVAVTNNQGVSFTNNQAVTVTGSIDNTSLTEAQLASHMHATLGQRNSNPRGARNWFDPAKAMTYSPPDGYAGGPVNEANNALDNTGSGTGHTHSHTLSGTLTGTITGTLSGAVTASGTNTFSPYVVVNYIIKH